MGSLTNTYENTVLNYIFNHTGSITNSTVYLALGTTALTDDGDTFTEVSAGGYTRKAISFGAASSRQVVQDADVPFDTATADWGTIRSYQIYTASSGGTAIAWGRLSTAKTVNNGNTATVSSGEVTISINPGACSNYLANALLDAIFNGTSYTAPSTYLGLWTVDLSDSSTGSTSGEVSGNNYSRAVVNNNGSTAPYWTTATSGALENHDDITFATPSGSWGTVTAMGILDNSGTGNLLFYDNGISDDPDDGDTVKYSASDLTITLTFSFISKKDLRSLKFLTLSLTTC